VAGNIHHVLRKLFGGGIAKVIYQDDQGQVAGKTSQTEMESVVMEANNISLF
jgi:hypothetical protein